MAITNTDVAILEAAIQTALADGTWRVQTISFSDQTTTLRSLDEALDLLARLKRLAAAGGGTTVRYAATRKGV